MTWRLLVIDIGASPVLFIPGEALRVDVWKIGGGDASFRAMPGERNVIVQDFGRCEYRT